MRRPSLFVACTALVLAAAGCGGAGHGSGSSGAAGGSSGAVYLAAVAKAADVTGQVPGYKFELTSSTSFAGQSFSVHGTGSIDDRGRQGSMSLQVEGKTLSEVISRPYVYVEVPSGSGGSVPGGKPWLRTEISTFTRSFGGSSLGSSSADPTQTLSFLKAAGTVAKLGVEDVRGVPATRYHATVELARYPATVQPGERASAHSYVQTVKRITGSDTLPIDVWIDAQSHVRRVALSLKLCSPQGKIDESIDMTLYDYGPQPAVEPPAASQVADIGERLGAEAEKNLQKLHC
jgi:hypothetical protein